PIGARGSAVFTQLREGSDFVWFDRVVLRPGAAGPAVAEARRRLRKLGFIFPPGSDARPYDEALAAAVARFQAACGLRPDGVVGPATWRRLLEDRLGPAGRCRGAGPEPPPSDRKSTRLNSSHVKISYAVFCLKKKK